MYSLSILKDSKCFQLSSDFHNIFQASSLSAELARAVEMHCHHFFNINTHYKTTKQIMYT